MHTSTRTSSWFLAGASSLAGGLRLRLLAVVAVLAALVVGIAPASAQLAHPDVVSERPVAWTPHVENGTVNAIAVVGDTVVVGGTFTDVVDASRQVHFPRRYLFGFGLRDGRISQLQAHLDGPVHTLAAGPDGTVYVGGSFRTVNGVAQRGVTQLRVTDGSRVPQFRAGINWGAVLTMARHGNWVYVGGTFTAVNGTGRAGLARLHAGTGTLDSGFDARLEFHGAGQPNVQQLTLAPGGDRLAAVGAFTSAQERRRHQLMIMETAGAQARLADWYTDAYEQRCAPSFRTYLRGVDFAPDGSYLVVATTGGMSRPDRLCNTAARFDTTGTGMHRPVWVNHTGGNSLYSVASTGAAVYVGGHQQWQDNPHGNKSAGPGAVPREGIAALHPQTGRALPWNPGRARGVGVQAFLATSDGLFVGSDTTRIGGVYRGRIAMLPLA